MSVAVAVATEEVEQEETKVVDNVEEQIEVVGLEDPIVQVQPPQLQQVQVHRSQSASFRQ